MRKKIRYYTWLIGGIIARYRVTIGISFLVALILVVTGFRLSQPLKQRLTIEHQVIGLAGSVTPTNLPLFLQRLLSLGLTDVDDSGQVKGAIAKSWVVSSDGKTYTFILRDDLYWHDKLKFTARDVNYNLKDVQFEPVSDTELTIKLKDTFTPLPSFLSKPLFKQGLVGLGTYRVSAIRLKGDSVVYLKLDSLRAGISPIEIKFYPSETAVKLAFRLGEVNILREIHDPAPFTSEQNLSVVAEVNYHQYAGIFFNLNDELLKNKEVRQALTFAIPKEVKNRIAGPISSKSWAYTNRVKQYDQDLETAKKLLGEKSSGSQKLTLSTFTPFLELAQNIAAVWTELGIATVVKVENGIPDNYQALLVTHEIPSDPDQYALWHSTQTETNISHYINPKIDKLLEDGRKESDPEKRKKIYFDFQRYLVEDAPAAFLFHPTTYIISRR